MGRHNTHHLLQLLTRQLQHRLRDFQLRSRSSNRVSCMQASTHSRISRVRRLAALQRPRCPVDGAFLMQTRLNPCSLPLRVGRVRAPQSYGALPVFLPASMLQWQPVRYPGRPRCSCCNRAAAAAVRKNGACERAEFLHRLQDIRTRTCTLCIRARIEDFVAYDGVGLCPLLPGVWRHTLRHAKPLGCRRLSPGWCDGCGCTQIVEARRHRRLLGAAAATPSLRILILLPVFPGSAGLGALAFAGFPLRACTAVRAPACLHRRMRVRLGRALRWDLSQVVPG